MMPGPLSRHPDAPAMQPRLAGAVAVTLPISPTFDPRPAPDPARIWARPDIDFRLLTDAAGQLQASIGRLRDHCAAQAKEYDRAAAETYMRRARRRLERWRDLEAAQADELGYAAEAIGAIRTIIGGGR